jgi:hypothetical protein
MFYEASIDMRCVTCGHDRVVKNVSGHHLPKRQCNTCRVSIYNEYRSRLSDLSSTDQAAHSMAVYPGLIRAVYWPPSSVIEPIGA